MEDLGLLPLDGKVVLDCVVLVSISRFFAGRQKCRISRLETLMSVTFVSWRCSCSRAGLSVKTKIGFCHSPTSLNVCAMSVDRKPRIANVTIASTSAFPFDTMPTDVDPPLMRPTVYILLTIHTNAKITKARQTTIIIVWNTSISVRHWVQFYR